MSKQQDELNLLCDLTVVKLGKKLRILGFDTEIIKTVNQQTVKELLKDTNTQLSNNPARCVYCNEVLEDCPKEEVIGRVPVYIFETLEHFKRCPKCGKVYWQGTHLVKCKEFFASRGEENDM